jgi:lysozyme family protein
VRRRGTRARAALCQMDRPVVDVLGHDGPPGAVLRMARAAQWLPLAASLGSRIDAVDFDAAFDILIDPQHEGGYSFDPADPGGETMYGVTARVARRHGYTGAMADLPLQTAKDIARAEYWAPAHCDDLPEAFRFDMFDCAYNTGVHEALVLLQRSAGVQADGVFGPATASAIGVVGPEALRRIFNGARLQFYTNLPGWLHEGHGWANRIATNLMRP